MQYFQAVFSVVTLGYFDTSVKCASLKGLNEEESKIPETLPDFKLSIQYFTDSIVTTISWL